MLPREPDGCGATQATGGWVAGRQQTWFNPTIGVLAGLYLGGFSLINKIADSVAEAIGNVDDGATVLIGGFGTAGIPDELIDGLIAQGARGLTIVNNNAGNGEVGLARLLKNGQAAKLICSFPRQTDSWVFDELYRSKKIQLELLPQGNLSERVRAAAAGIGAFFTPTGYGTALAKHPDGSPKETRVIDGKGYVLEYPIAGDLALIKAEAGDRWGNLTYRMSARNFGPVMAAGAKRTVATVHRIVELGELDPEHIITPGIHVSKIVKIAFTPTQGGGIASPTTPPPAANAGRPL